MELSIAQEALIHFLKQQGVEREMILLISLMFLKSERGIRAFIHLCHHDRVERQEEHLMLATAIVQQLPPEERIGEVMDLRIKL